MRYVSQLPLAGCALLAAFLSTGVAFAAPPAAGKAAVSHQHDADEDDDDNQVDVAGLKKMLARLPPPSSSKPDDPVKIAAARSFIIAYHPRQDPAFVAKVLPKFMPKMIEGAKQQNPKVDVKKFVAERTAQILAQTTKSLDEQARVVSQHFTLQELNGLAAFYRSGLGKRLTEETPKIQNQMRIEARRKMLMSQIPGMEKPAAKPTTPAAKPSTPAMKGPGTPNQ